MVQARWGHINQDYSLLTQDPVDPARRRTSSSSTAAATARGRFFNFNGTAGIWRRAAIDDAAAGSTTR